MTRIRTIATMVFTIAAIAALVLVPASSAFASTPPSSPSSLGSYFVSANMSLTGMTGTIDTTYRYSWVKINIDSHQGTAITGEIYLYRTSTAAGAKITNGTGKSKNALLTIGAKTITVTTAGTFHVIMPKGVSATAASGTATVTSSPVSCGENATTDITVTGTGTITVTCALVQTNPTATLAGVIGTGTHPRISIIISQASTYMGGSIVGTLYTKTVNGTTTITRIAGHMNGFLVTNGGSGSYEIFNTDFNGAFTPASS